MSLTLKKALPRPSVGKGLYQPVDYWVAKLGWTSLVRRI